MAEVTSGEIKQIAMAVKNVDTATAFYEKTLGLKLLFRAEPAMAFLQAGGIRLMLSQAKNVNPGGPILYFACRDIEGAYKSLVEAGAEVIREPLMTHKTDTSQLWLAFFKDPDGHTLGLFEEKVAS